jgi:hydroxyacylglutathione hydrolase
MPNLTIHPIPTLKDNYVWALVSTPKRLACIVDPGEAGPVLTFLKQQGLKLMGILITHHHWDHTNGIAGLKQHSDVPVYGAASETIDGKTVSLHEGDRVELIDFPLSFRVMSIPGHTLGHLAYYSPGMLFCGDTLFASGCGRLFEGKPEQLYTSLQKLAALPDETKVYCAHEYTLANLHFAEKVEPGNPEIKERLKQVEALHRQHQCTLPSTLGEEKKTNPFLRCDSPELIQSVQRHAGRHLSNPIEVFTYLRKWKDTY